MQLTLGLILPYDKKNDSVDHSTDWIESVNKQFVLQEKSMIDWRNNKSFESELQHLHIASNSPYPEEEKTLKISNLQT